MEDEADKEIPQIQEEPKEKEIEVGFISERSAESGEFTQDEEFSQFYDHEVIEEVVLHN